MLALKLLRTLRGLRLETVATACGSHRSSICTAELHNRVSKRLRKRLANYFHIPEAALFREIDTNQLHDQIVNVLKKKDTPQ